MRLCRTHRKERSRRKHARRHNQRVPRGWHLFRAPPRQDKETVKQRILMEYVKDPEWGTCEVGWYRERGYPELAIPFFGRRIKLISAPVKEVEIVMYIGRAS